MPVIDGTPDNDFLVGSFRSDTINGFGGNDTLNGNGGSDTLDGGDDDDLLNGGGGFDNLLGGNGNDTLNGGFGSDTLDGGDGNDTLNGDGGSDTFIGSAGNDAINGGGGFDTVDYSNLGEAVTLLSLGTIDKGSLGQDTLIGLGAAQLRPSIQTIIGATGEANTIDGSPVDGFSNSFAFNINLAAESLRIIGLFGRFNIVNFTDVIGTQNNDRITGDGADNTFFGSAGNDTFNGGDGGFDTVDYSDLGEAVTLLALGAIDKGSQGRDTLVGLGSDQLVPSIDAIVGATGEANTIDGSPVGGFSNAFAFDIDLAANSLEIAGLGGGFEVVNFTDVVGTQNDDSIAGDGADNTFFGSAGIDTLNGGDGGFDTVDYSDLGEAVTLLSLGAIDKGSQGQDTLVGLGSDQLIPSIDAIVGATGEANTIDGSPVGGFSNAFAFDIDLAANSLEIAGLGGGFEVVNFTDVVGTQNDDSIAGDGADNTFFGSAGIDTLNGGDGGFDTVDYSDLGEAVTLLSLGAIDKGSQGQDTLVGLGSDQLIPSIDAIVGATGEANTIDGSPVGGFSNAFAFDIDLAANSLEIAGLNGGFEVVNFTDVVGTQNDDSIVGDANDNNLIGGSGDDTLVGGGGDDTLNGVDGSAANPGSGEIDSLTGGGNSDLFVLGDADGAFYLGEGDSDFAFIEDFQIFGGTSDTLLLSGASSYLLGESSVAGADLGLFVDDGNGVLGSEDDLIAALDISFFASPALPIPGDGSGSEQPNPAGLTLDDIPTILA